MFFLIQGKAMQAIFKGGPLDGQVHEIAQLDELVAVDREWLTHRGVVTEHQTSLYALIPNSNQPSYEFKGYASLS
jgi:hypothetical protein